MEGHRVAKGRYEIQEVLKQSGPMVTYKAVDVLLKRDCALKTFREAPDAAASESFQKECALLARFSHPNVIEVFDLGEMDGEAGPRPFFVSPYLAGHSLEDLISAESRRLSPVRVTEFMSQVCRGVQAAYDCGVMHGELETGDILLLKDDAVKITRFPVNSALGQADHIRRLGEICYEALALKKPDLSRPLRRLHDVNKEVTELLSATIHRALDRGATTKFASVRDFGEALAAAGRNETVPQRKTAPEPARAPAAASQTPGEFTQYFSAASLEHVSKPPEPTPPPKLDATVQSTPVEEEKAGPGEFTQFFQIEHDKPAAAPAQPITAAPEPKKAEPPRSEPSEPADGFTAFFRTGDKPAAPPPVDPAATVMMPVQPTAPPKVTRPPVAPRRPEPPQPEPIPEVFRSPEPAVAEQGSYTRIMQTPPARGSRVSGTDIFSAPAPEQRRPAPAFTSGPSEVRPVKAGSKSQGTPETVSPSPAAPVAPSRRSAIWLAVLFGVLGFAAVILFLFFALRR